MSLTYDQKSEIRLAFDEAFVEPERRRSVRLKHTAIAEIRDWKDGKQSMPFQVRIDDVSPTGVGMVHAAPLDVGAEFMIKVPRQKWGDLNVLMTVVRCEQRQAGEYQIGLQISNVLDESALTKFCDILKARHVTSRKTKLLFILFGMIGLAVVAWIC